MLPEAVTPENAPIIDRNENFQAILRTFESASHRRNFKMILQGKRLLITGGARRIGAAIAVKAAEAGCSVLLGYCNSANEADEVLAALPGCGHRKIQADLSTSAGVKKLIAEAGEFELLVNSAAIFHKPGSHEDLAAEKLYHQINFLAAATLLEQLFSQNIPHCAAVNITDAFALAPGSGAYWQSKRDLTELTISLAEKWAENDCRINAVAPGAVLPPPWAPESRMEKILTQVPLHRAVKVGDIAQTVMFLLENESITGAVIPVDCGISAKLRAPTPRC